jgi:hypothetical protein
MAVDLIYCATPSRLKDRKEDILNFVNEKTPYAPFHPFTAFPWELFEGNKKVGRKNAMNYCIRSIDICDRFGLFGISEGTATIELPYALSKNKPIDLFVEEFDPDWRKYFQELENKNPNLRKELERIGVIYG